MQISTRSTISTLLLLAAAPAASGQCLTTLFAGNNQGSPGGAVYFDLNVQNNTSITSIEANFTQTVGSPVGMEIWTRPTTYVGSTGSSAGWTMVAVDDGLGLAAGVEQPTLLNLLSPLLLAPGDYGVAMVAIGSGNRYTNGTGANQMYTDGNLTINAGAATNVPFTAPEFFPRVWNGSLCTGGSTGIGTNYCGPAVPNSTTNSGVITATGSALATDNNVTLTASDLPANQFGYFLTSMTQGFVPNPGGSQGNLCLGSPIGRFNAQIQNSGAAGSMSIPVDLTAIPTNPASAVMGGQTWRFQAWYRDVNPGTTSNFTDAVEVPFQ
jgi:hypothetical protein